MFKCWFNFHNFEIFNETFNKPSTVLKISNVSPEFVAKLYYGWTIHLQKCTRCGKFNSFETIGDVRLK